MKSTKSTSVVLASGMIAACLFSGMGNSTVDAQSDAKSSGTIVSPSKSAETISLAYPLSSINESDRPLVEKYLIEGRLKEGESALTTELNKQPKDDQLRFGLGTLQLISSIEQLAQDLFKYGLRENLSRDVQFVPILRMPLPNNPNPRAMNYEQAQNIIRRFDTNLEKTEKTLSGISDANVKLPIHFGLIRLDLNGDGKAEDSEMLWKLYYNMNHNQSVDAAAAKNFYIAFDRGDVHWMRGYCHLLMSFCDIFLAHDCKETFDCTAHLFFKKVDSPYKFLTQGKHVHTIGEDVEILDLIALVHLIRWQVVEPARMESALHHLEAVVAQSKESWKWILAETDDDHEWLPNPNQTGVMPDVHVTEEMVSSWQYFMEKFGKVLAGDLLIPFWRGNDERGINIRKVFLEPRTFDLVLWVQGTAAAPYLQNGETVKGANWRRVESAFGNQFPGFAVYFN